MENNFEGMTEALNNFVVNLKQDVSEIQEGINSFMSALSATFSKIKIPTFEISEETALNFDYIISLSNLKYPLFLEDNIEFKKAVVNKIKSNDSIEELVDDFINNDSYLDAMLLRWGKLQCINTDRYQILTEAIVLHKNKYFYSSTATLMCQLLGIVIDLDQYCKRNNMGLSKEEKKKIASYYDIQLDKINTEKSKAIQISHTTSYGVLLQEAIATYLKEEILSSSNSKDKWSETPLRNKICHGSQLNYGTKIHSLKAILTIDLLFRIGESIENYLKINDET